MRLLYATSIRFPSALANRIQTTSMAKAFSRVLAGGFYLSGNDIVLEDNSVNVANLGLKRSYKLAWKTLLFAKRSRITHIYAREARLLFFIVLYNFFIFRLRLIYVYEVHALLGRSSIDTLSDAFLSLFVKRYVFVTKALADIYAKKYRIRREKITVEPDAVDLEIFGSRMSREEARRRFSLPQDKLIVGYLGQLRTLAMDKGVADILEALKQLPESVLFLAVGGSEPDRILYKALAEEKGVTTKTVFIGHVSQRELALYQRACDILIMPFPFSTHFAYYMSPLKMFEYMASERPIIATDLPSVREILDDTSAVILPPGKPTAIAQAIVELARDPKRQNRLASEAKKRVERHTWAGRAERIVAWSQRN